MARIRVGLALGAVCVLGVATAAGVRHMLFVGQATPQKMFNGWTLSPIGDHIHIPQLPLKMVFSPDGKTVVAISGGFAEHGLTLISAADHKITQSMPLKRAWNGLAFSKDGSTLYVSGGNSGRILPFHFSDGSISVLPDVKPSADDAFVAGIAVHPTTGALYVCNEANREVWLIDPNTLLLKQTIRVGMNPHTCVFGADHRHLYVSNWGNASVSVIDTETNKRVRDYHVGVRPNDMAVAPDGRLFVACAGDNTVHVIQTKALEQQLPGASPMRRLPEGLREILTTSLYPYSPEGSTPDAIAISPDGKKLYVANADNNDLMVADISNPDKTEVQGFIPTGWYPSALAVGTDTIFVGVGKGLGSRRNAPPQLADPAVDPNGVKFDYLPSTLQGYVSFVPIPTLSTLVEMTAQVKKNTPFTPTMMKQTAMRSDCVIPDKVGEPCPIKHVLYIVKENRTYDQVLGDLKDAKGRPLGHGDPSLTMYGENVTPNHHQLAREYVLLDNLYCNGEVSVDGHSWCDAAIATDGNERNWLMSYSDHGDLGENQQVMAPSAGFIWTQCRSHGLTVKAYGEGADEYLGGYAVPIENRGTWSGGRDMDRVNGWIKDLHDGEKNGNLANFMIMSLGEDHTAGLSPGDFAPTAAVGSNDVGIAKIVAAASKSPLWRSMAIFIVEDDAQDGPDHIDGHRTVGLIVSPYTKRGFVDSTPYTQVSMLRTMELILGIPPMTQYDAAATPMFNSFTRSPRLEPYAMLQPRVDLAARNPKTGPGASASLQMDFSHYDRAPADKLNRLLWVAAKGPNVPYPTRHRSYTRF